MKKISQGLLLASIIISESLLACIKGGVGGFLPENSFNIPVNPKNVTSMTEEEFHAVIDKIETMYSPIVSQQGGSLQVQRRWTDGTVNAYAEQEGTDWKIFMFGGLARHETMTQDGLSLVVCHELGHHIGGAPKYLGDDWASNEGQADYFATLKCLRRIWQTEDNAVVVRRFGVKPFLAKSCEKQWSNQIDRDICIRAGMAGDSVASLFAALSMSERPDFETPDLNVVLSTNDGHPASQCRLDTYFQGALCEQSFNEEIGSTSEVDGACHGFRGHTLGLRPKCWFKPSVE